MKHRILALVLVLSAAACGKSAEDRAREDMAKDQAAHPDPTPPAAPAAVHQGSAGSAAAAQPDAPPAPEPTTPAEIEHARNQAMIDGRDKDVLKWCDTGKLDDKSNPQALLGCSLAACRLKDEDTAKRYAKPLPKLLMDQAKKVCLHYNVTVP